MKQLIKVMAQIPNDILVVVNYVMTYATSTRNWLDVKKEILWICKPKLRSLFSRRHYSTKKHSLNDLERQIIKHWSDSTGIVLEIPENKMHNPEWVRNPVGWGIDRYNAERQHNLQARKQHQQG